MLHGFGLLHVFEATVAVCATVGQYSVQQGLSQDLETDCPKLAILKVRGISFLKGDHNILRL